MTACLFMYFLLCLSLLLFFLLLLLFIFTRQKNRWCFQDICMPCWWFLNMTKKKKRENCELEAMTIWSCSSNKNIWESFIDPAVCNRALQSKRFAVNDIASIPVAIRVDWWKTTNRQKESKKTAKRMGSSVNTKSRYDIHVHSFSKIVQCA